MNVSTTAVRRTRRIKVNPRCSDGGYASALIDSPETSEEGGVDEAWRAELLRQRQELRAGAVQAAPWAKIRARMSAM